MGKVHFLTFCTAHGNPLSCFRLRLYMHRFKNLKNSLLIGLTGLFLFSFSSQKELAVQPCKQPEVKHTIKHTTGNLENGEVTLEFSDAGSNYTYFLFSGDGANRLEGKESTINNLKRGDYNLYVQNAEGCTKHIKFKIN